MAKGFLPYDVDQHLLLPPNMRSWLPEGHLALFVLDVVQALDISQIYQAYVGRDDRGRAGYDPTMMVALLIYAYCVGKPSSRKIEKATYEEVEFRVLSGDTHPDHDCVADFRKRHLAALVDGATKAYIQGYNAQIAVDSEAQVIVACTVIQEANDKRQLAPMVEQVKENAGMLPGNLSADAGYFSAESITSPALTGVNLLVPPDRRKHGEETTPKRAHPSPDSVDEQMRQKLRTEAGYALYRMRKAIVEPVFGRTKEVRGFRRFRLRGIKNVRCEFDLIALTHNLLKLFRASACPQPI